MKSPSVAPEKAVAKSTGESGVSDEPKTSWDDVIAGRRIEDWEWAHVPDGFRELQSQLKWQIGLFAAKLGAQFMYIGAGTQKQAGLRAALARARLKAQSGNSSYGMSQVRAAGSDVEAYVIKMTDLAEIADITDLKWALIDLHRPL